MEAQREKECEELYATKVRGCRVTEINGDGPWSLV